MYHRVGLLGVLCATGAAIAEPAPITGKSISETFTSASIILDTPLGTKLPVKYGANGLISGEGFEFTVAPLIWRPIAGAGGWRTTSCVTSGSSGLMLRYNAFASGVMASDCSGAATTARLALQR